MIRTKHQYLRQLVSDKNEWCRPLTDEEKSLGFLGWHERGYLPHCDFPGLVQFVTLRLADSMPASRRSEWEYLLAIENVREKRTKLEEYLDRGVGECWLRDKRIAKLAEDSFLHFNQERFDLLAWCVMPNHVHLLIHIWRMPLDKIIQSWKRHIATQSQIILAERRSPTRRISKNVSASIERAGSQTLRWQREYWDTFMRDEQNIKTAIRYIENNPVKAKLCCAPENWPFSSARYRDNFQNLTLFPK